MLYLCKNFACLGLVIECKGERVIDAKCGDKDTTSSGWFSSSSLIDGNAKHGPISDSAYRRIKR